MKKFFSDFKQFCMRGNILDLAIGVMIGGAFSSIVTSLVNDILMPIIGLITGGVDFSGLFLAFDFQIYPSMDAARALGVATLNYGAFLQAVLNFLIMAFCIFMITRLLTKILPPKKEEPKKPGPKCPYCKQDIDKAATRCPHCTSDLTQSANPAGESPKSVSTQWFPRKNGLNLTVFLYIIDSSLCTEITACTRITAVSWRSLLLPFKIHAQRLLSECISRQQAGS